MLETIKGERNKAILDEYTKILKRAFKSGKQFRMDDVYRELMEAPAPKFFTTYRKASFFVKMILNGEIGKIPSGRYRKEMYLEIARRFQQEGAGDIKRIDLILEQPAPSFYLSKDSLVRVICQNIRKR